MDLQYIHLDCILVVFQNPVVETKAQSMFVWLCECKLNHLVKVGRKSWFWFNADKKKK